ncbi:MazG nucleotide pyrophosphohydrolase domain-containing protein [Bacillus infantis]|uniref:MazG nucleotide pyrophosphohydrolase domain-containing protein n=1 Tax=Bacillus infantis TaxID=324767 RepID=UPI003CF1A28A
MGEYKRMNQENAIYYGYANQTNQLIEECAELIQAINKHKRFMVDGDWSRDDAAEVNNSLKAHIAEEMADVEVMLMQVRFLIGIDHAQVKEIMKQKIERTTARRKWGEVHNE